MKKVTGLGGIFFKTSNQVKNKAWYLKNLGIESDQYGGKFTWRDDDNPEKRCITAWSPFAKDTTYFEPSDQDFMINYRVHDLDALLKELKANDVEIVGEPETYEYGKFAWILDPDGQKIELWEPIDQPLL